MGGNNNSDQSSMFPKLEKLEIESCKNLEFLFPSTVSSGPINSVDGNSDNEDHLQHQNRNVFYLPSLEVLSLQDVPKLTSICPMNYKLTSPSQHSSTTKKSNVADDGHAQVHIFPRLEKLEIVGCKEWKFLFPSSISVGLNNLKSLTIKDAPILRDFLGAYQDALKFQNLCLRDMPKFVYGAINQYLAPLSLREVVLADCGIKSFTDLIVFSAGGQSSGKPTMEIQASGDGLLPLDNYVAQSLSIQALINVREIKLVKCWELTSLSTLSIASTILWEKLTIQECHKLKCIVEDKQGDDAHLFCRSIFPKLQRLEISKCEQFVKIVEEHNDENGGDHLRHQPSFPELQNLSIIGCRRLEYLFSITVSSILPKLEGLDIEEASALEHVLIREDEPKEMAMKDVLPQLMYIRLQKLPRLISICHGIDFRTLKESSQVDHCPNFSFHETTANHLQGTQEKHTSHLINTNPSDTGKAKGTPHSTREIVEVDVF